MSAARHDGRVVVVTGGGSGIGLATSRRFALEGATVYILGRDKDRLVTAADQLRLDDDLTVTPVVADVTEPVSMAAAAVEIATRSGHVDTLIANAGLPAPSTDVADANFVTNLRDRLSIDVIGTAVTAQSFLHVLTRGSSVLTMGSVYATTAASGAGSYSAGKGAVIGLTKALAVELGPRGIRVNCVSPGWVDVEKWDNYFGDETLQHLRGGFERVPLRAAVTADEIASVYAFLAHEDAVAITGQDIVVDRGMSTDLYVVPTIPGLS